MDISLGLAMLLCAVSILVGFWAGRSWTNRRLDPRRNPLRELMRPAVLSEAVDLAARRVASRASTHAMMHGRIDQLAMLRTAWTPDTRDQVQEHIAAVMRAGLRRGDRIVMSGNDGETGNFTILVPGADERSAVGIADRLRRTLAQLHLPQLGGAAKLTASFGVAADRFGESREGLDRRARRALDTADAGHVVPASEIEEIFLLPAPAPSRAASAA